VTVGLVDVHTHFMPAALVRALERRDGFPRIERSAAGAYIHYGPGSGNPLLRSMERLDARLEDMDRQGIDVAVLCVNVPGVDAFDAADGIAVAREANDELASIVAASGGRIASLAVLPGQAPEAAAAELERAVGAGLCGAAVFSNVGGTTLDAPGMEVIFDTAAALDVPVLLHPTFPLSAAAVDVYGLIPTLGFLVDTTTAALRLVLGGLYERHPEFKLVVPHTASLIPWLVGRIDYEGERMPNGFGVLSEKPSVHLKKLYADIVSDFAPAVRLLVDLLGPDRVMYGSDYPFWDPDRSTRVLGEVGLAPGALERVRRGTAAALFRLDAPPAPPPA
jgi:predicted TIM-barrel fold metal-dependent hydrolase